MTNKVVQPYQSSEEFLLHLSTVQNKINDILKIVDSDQWKMFMAGTDDLYDTSLEETSMLLTGNIKHYMEQIKNQFVVSTFKKHQT